MIREISSLCTTRKSISLKRIIKDIEELQKEPADGIGFAQLENNIYRYVVNVKLLYGSYEKLILQLEMTLSEDYPFSPPKIRLYPNQNFHIFHHHVFQSTDNYEDLCIDIINNKFFDSDCEKSGWTPSYTLKTLLYQIQNFLAIHDKIEEPDENTIKSLFHLIRIYSRKFTDEYGNKVIHSYDNPYPKIYQDKNNLIIYKQIDMEKEEKKKLLSNKMQDLKNNVCCFITKINYIEDNSLILGYPVFIKKDFKNRRDYIPIPEILSYEAFVNEIQNIPEFLKLDYYFDINFKTSMGEYYTHWFPIYLDDKHFEKNKQTILNSFCVLKYGPQGFKKYDFDCKLIFEIMPNFLNKMIIELFNKGSVFSQVSIRCYFNFIFLFRKLIFLYETEFKDYIFYKFHRIIENGDVINKENVPDIGNFLMLIFFSDFNIKKDYIANVFEDFISRQFYWILHAPDTKYLHNKCILKILANDKNLLKRFSYNEIEDLLNYSRLEVFEILDNNTKNELMDYYFSQNKGNKLIVISNLASIKIKDKGFFSNLENNYGILMDSDINKFLQLTKNRLESIRNFYDLSIELGLDFVFEIREKTFEKLIYLYYTAKTKNYLNLKVSSELEKRLNQKYKINKPIKAQTKYKESIFNKKEENKTKNIYNNNEIDHIGGIGKLTLSEILNSTKKK